MVESSGAIFERGPTGARGIISNGSKHASNAIVGDAAEEAAALAWIYRAVAGANLDEDAAEESFSDLLGGAELIRLPIQPSLFAVEGARRT